MSLTISKRLAGPAHNCPSAARPSFLTVGSSLCTRGMAGFSDDRPRTRVWRGLKGKNNMWCNARCTVFWALCFMPVQLFRWHPHIFSLCFFQHLTGPVTPLQLTRLPWLRDRDEGENKNDSPVGN